jgi:cysteine sulfinate desulfinase/cysteine desulfurase-like protein
MGLAPERVQASLRLSVGRFTTAADIERASDLIASAVLAQRERRHPSATRA